MAFLEGRVESSVAVPAAVLDALAHHGRPDPQRRGRPLLITEAELLDSEFQTDRGRQRMPAWRLTAQDALGPIWVLDPDVVDWQPAADAGGSLPDLQTPGQDPGARVDVGADEHSLVVHWLGASPAFERYPTAEVVSAQAFAVVPVGVDIGPPEARTGGLCIRCQRLCETRSARGSLSTCTATPAAWAMQPIPAELADSSRSGSPGVL